MEPPTKTKGRPRKMYPEPSSDADIEFVKMYNHYMALKKAQRAYYQRNKERLIEKQKKYQIEKNTSAEEPSDSFSKN